MTTTKEKFVSLRERLTAAVEAREGLDRLEAMQGDMATRLMGECDAVLALLSQMLVQHAARPDLVRDIRERMDSTLDERLRLSCLAGSSFAVLQVKGMGTRTEIF
jgi:predicted small integral membrane protein